MANGNINIASIVAVIAIIAAVFLAARYIISEKKKGNKCIGCPYADSCNGKENAAHSYPTRF